MGRLTDISEMVEETFELGFVNQNAAFTEGENPGTPATPSNPGTPSTPSNPGTPSTPSNPGTPPTPSNPGTPSTPSNPGTPSTPSVPGTPSTPATPGTPATPANPGTPATPSETPSGNGNGGGNGGNPGSNSGGNSGGKTDKNPGKTNVALDGELIEEEAEEENAAVEANAAADPEDKTIALLRITNPEDEIVSNETVEVKEGETLDLDSETTEGEIPEFVEWESDHTDIATVDENGVVTFLKEGNVTISAHQMSDDTEEAIPVCSSSVKFTVAAPAPTAKATIGDIWPFILIGLLSIAIVILLVQRNIQEKRRKAAARKRRQRRAAEQAANETTAVNMAAPVLDNSEYVAQPNAGVRSAVFQAIGARKDQQDSYGMTDPALYSQQGVLGLVADGMGGLANGKAVSAALVNTFLGEFRNVSEYGKPQETLMKLSISANQRINQMLVGQDRSGSTLVSVIIRDGCLYFLTVGDSRIYLYRGGAMLQLNREHIYQEELAVKAVNCQVPISQITGDRQAHALTSFFGSGSISHMDRNYEGIRLLPGDRVLLCSDGVFGTLTQAQMEYALSQDVKTAAEMLKDMVREAGKAHQDNNTGMILEYLG